MRMIGFGLGGLVLVGMLGTAYLMQPKQQEPATNPAVASSQPGTPSATPSQPGAPPASAQTPAISAADLDKYSGDTQAVLAALPSLQTVMCTFQCKFDFVRIIGDYVWYERSGEEQFDVGIGVRDGKSWKKLQSGSKRMLPDDAIAAGVPKDIAEFLVPVAQTSGMVNAIINNEDINTFSEWELLVMRNTLYAQHGRKFTTARLQQYFETWPWYKPNPNYNESQLTEIEKENVIEILKVEKKKGYL